VPRHIPTPTLVPISPAAMVTLQLLSASYPILLLSQEVYEPDYSVDFACFLVVGNLPSLLSVDFVSSLDLNGSRPKSIQEVLASYIF
jgi:hypothetical protein